MHVKKLCEHAIIPQRAHDSDAGLDLFASERHLLFGINTLGHQLPTKIHTGISIQLPENTVGLICDRSSMGSKGIKVMGGVIDPGYTGEIIVCLHNLNGATIEIIPGDKIAQLLILPIIKVTPTEVKELNETTRNNNGFGSTGV